MTATPAEATSVSGGTELATGIFDWWKPEAGKPVFAAEYTDMDITLDDFCPQAEAWNFSAILKNRDLDAYLEVCQ